MALTRITKGVIKPNENYDTHDINSTGIITATGLNISGNASIGGVLTYEDVTNIDSIGIITARSGVDVDDFLSVGSNIHLGNSGIVTATKFIATGDNSYLKYIQVDSMEINSGLPRISLNDTNQENDYDIRVNNGQFQIYDQDTSDSTKERFIVESNGTVNITKGPFTVGTGVTLTSAGAGFYAGIITAANFEKSDGSPIAQVGGATSITMNDDVPINFGTDGLWRQYRNQDILYLQPANSVSQSRLWISANNQVWLRSGSGGTFLDCNGTRNSELYSTTFLHKTDVQIPDKLIHANDSNTAIRFPENDTFTVETAGTERLRINNTGITTLSGITTVTGNTLFADQLGVAGVSTFIGEIHGNNQRLGGLSGGRFNGLYVNNGYSYYGSNKILVADGNGFGFNAYGSNDSWMIANSGGGSAGDCYMKTGGSSGGYVYAKGADGVELHHSGTSDKKLETVSGGINVVGSLTVNGAALQSGIAGIDTTGTSHFNHLSVSGIATFSGTEAIFNRVSFPQSGNKTIVGNMAGSAPTGSEITLVGYAAGYASSGDRLTAVGRQAGRMVSGTDNTCIGYEAGYSNQGAQKNVFVGKDAGMGNKTGSNNIVVGSDAGEGVWNNANYSNSVILGAEAGAILTSSNSNVIVIGYDAEPSSNSVTNEITLGNSSINHLRVPGIGVTFATGGNHITGITTFSDRIKLGTFGEGEIYASNGIKAISTNRIELESANQLYIHAQSSGLFLRASNQEVISVYGGSGGGVYFRHNGTQKLKLEGGNWTYQGSPTVTFDGNILASSDSAIDIGTNSVRFRNIYADTLYGDGSNLTGISGGGGGVTSDSEENTVGGTDAGAALDSDTYRNTLFGFDTGKVINSGDDNTIMGWKAGDAITSGYKNCAVGSEALPNCNSGHNNVAMGWEAGRSLTSGNNNVCLGPMAGRSLGGGAYNIALGYHALSNVGSPSRCIGIGGDSVFLGGTDVIGIGQGTMMKGNSQVGGIGIGRYAGRSNAGDHNVYIGYEAGQGYLSSSPYSTGNYNLSMGYQSLYDIKEGYNNIAIGSSAGSNIDDGYDNVLIGVRAGHAMTTNQGSVYIGRDAGYNTKVGGQVAIGKEALMYSGATFSTSDYRGSQHTAIGNQCMKNLSVYVNYNTAVGEGAMRSATAGFNAAFGQNALASGSGEINTAIGMNSLDVCNGSWNSALGYKSGDDCTSGSKNSLIGVYAGEDIGSGSHNLCLGAYSTVSASGVSNECVIGAPAGHASVINHVRMPGIGVSFSDGGAVISGVVTATSFVGDGSGLTGLSGGALSVDANNNFTAGTRAGEDLNSGAFSNLFIGYEAGKDTTGGDNNIALGSVALEENQGGNYNVAIGPSALKRCVSGGANIAIGSGAGQKTTGSNNVFYGFEAGYNNTSGTDNVYLGKEAGSSTNSGSNNIVIGSGADPSSSAVSNEITLGDANITNFRVPGVHIGITANAASLPAAIFRPGVIQETYHNDTGGGMQSNYTHNILTYGMVWYGSTNAVGSWTFNIQGDASTTFNSLTSTGKVTTMTMYSANNSTSHYMTAFKIDGTTQTVKWAGGSAPSAATGSGVDVYSMTIMKTGSNTYHVFGNVTNFA